MAGFFVTGAEKLSGIVTPAREEVLWRIEQRDSRFKMEWRRVDQWG
jgi:hypothetical protein